MTKEEFEIKYNKYFDMLFRVAYRYVKNAYEAENIVQDVFIKLYLKNKQFKDESHEKYYLLRLVINRSIDYIRHNKSQNLSLDNEYVNNVPDNTNKQDEDIYNCVCLLGDNYKTIIILYYYENINLKEIASVLKISYGNAKVRLNRAREELKKIIEERR